MSHVTSTRTYQWSSAAREGSRPVRLWSPTGMMNASIGPSGFSVPDSPLPERPDQDYGFTTTYTDRVGLNGGHLRPLANDSTSTHNSPTRRDEPPPYELIFGSGSPSSSSSSGSESSYTSAHSTWAAASIPTSGVQSGSPTRSQAPHTSHGESSGRPLTSNTTAKSKKPWYKPSTWARSNSQRQPSRSSRPPTGASDYVQPGSEFDRPHRGRRERFENNVNEASVIMRGIMIGWNRANHCHH